MKNLILLSLLLSSSAFAAEEKQPETIETCSFETVPARKQNQNWGAYLMKDSSLVGSAAIEKFEQLKKEKESRKETSKDVFGTSYFEQVLLSKTLAEQDGEEQMYDFTEIVMTQEQCVKDAAGKAKCRLMCYYVKRFHDIR